MRQRDADGCLSTLIVVAEGARPKDGSELMHKTDSGEYRLGGIARSRRARSRRAHWQGNAHLRARPLQRGGAPTTLDRILGTRFGVHAVEMIEAGQIRPHGQLPKLLGDSTCPIAEAVHRLRLVSAEQPDGPDRPRRRNFLRRLKQNDRFVKSLSDRLLARAENYSTFTARRQTFSVLSWTHCSSF